MRLAITLNANPTSEPCPLCETATNPNIGPELTNEKGIVICRPCGNFYAPALTALLALADLARNFVQAEDSLGDAWLITRTFQATGERRAA